MPKNKIARLFCLFAVLLLAACGKKGDGAADPAPFLQLMVNGKEVSMPAPVISSGKVRAGTVTAGKVYFELATILQERGEMLVFETGRTYTSHASFMLIDADGTAYTGSTFSLTIKQVATRISANPMYTQLGGTFTATLNEQLGSGKQAVLSGSFYALE